MGGGEVLFHDDLKDRCAILAPEDSKLEPPGEPSRVILLVSSIVPRSVDTSAVGLLSGSQPKRGRATQSKPTGESWQTKLRVVQCELMLSQEPMMNRPAYRYHSGRLIIPTGHQ